MAISTKSSTYSRKTSKAITYKTGGQLRKNISQMSSKEIEEFLDKEFLPKIIFAKQTFAFSGTGFTYDFDSNTKQDVLDYFYETAHYNENSLKENTSYEVDGWEIVRNDDGEKVELKQLNHDNTSNYNYLGLIDLDYKLFFDEEYDTYFILAHPHLGGDPRGNYGNSFILRGDDRDELLSDFFINFIDGQLKVSFDFIDGSEASFVSTEYNDVPAYELDEETQFSMYSDAELFDKTFSTLKDTNQKDEFITYCYENFNKKGASRTSTPTKMAKGGGVDDEPMAYIQILGYSEGKWINLSDFSGGSDVVEHIEEWMNELNEQDGQNREEWEVRDYEGWGNILYSESMGEKDFENIIETYETYKSSDFPLDVVEQYAKDINSEDLENILSSMNKNFRGSYKDLSDFAYRMVEDGVYNPSVSDVYVTDTDKRIISSEEATRQVENMSFEQRLEKSDLESEYEDLKEGLEEELSDLESSVTSLETEKEELEESLSSNKQDYELIAEMIAEKEIEISEKQEEVSLKEKEIADLESEYEDKAKDEAESVIQSEIYDQLDTDLEGFLDEYDYDKDDLKSISFIVVDYNSIGKDLESEYNIIEDDMLYIFDNHAKGGRVKVKKSPTAKFTHFIVENTTETIIKGLNDVDNAYEQKNKMSREYPKLKFNVYTKAKLKEKLKLDPENTKNWNTADVIKSYHKVAVHKGGGHIKTNEDVLHSFLTSNKEVSIGNLSVHYNSYDNQILLRNYGTLIATRKDDNVTITNQKFSKTTTTIQNKLKSMATKMEMNILFVEQFEVGGALSEISDMFPTAGDMSTIVPMKKGGDVSEQMIVYVQSGDDFKKISEHKTYSGALVKMNKLIDKGDYNMVGIMPESAWIEFYDTYIHEDGAKFKQKIKDSRPKPAKPKQLYKHKTRKQTAEILEKLKNTYRVRLIEETDFDGKTIESVEYLKESDFNPETGVFEKIEVLKQGGGVEDEVIEIPNEEKMFHLPLEIVVYVPSTQDVDKNISPAQMNKRVNEVKQYLSSTFGGYSSANKQGGFIDSKGNLVNEEVTQVVSFGTRKDFEKNKAQLIDKIAEWGEEWGQEAIGFEFEGDLYYVPQKAELLEKGGELWIQEATSKMKKKGTLGSFSKMAERNNMSVIDFAKDVLKHPSDHHLKTVRRAQFYKNTHPSKF